MDVSPITSPLVGASLLAKAVSHSAQVQLTDCFREQARSHRGEVYGCQ
ncbi:hypothetical protein PS947_03501 [Pseudomonas fluorescens]|nr:hypothetical protein PS947_03501 [Pseudomonas fluorescens]